MKSRSSIRDSGIELLRIISMFLIIFHHYFIHGGYEKFSYETLTINQIFVQIAGVYGRAACAIFALISGYFMVKNGLTKRKVLSCVAELMFYSICITICLTIIMPGFFSKESIIRSFFPVFFGCWYVVYYIIFLMIVPFLNKMILALDKKSYTRFLIVLLIIWSVIPTLSNYAWKFSSIDFFFVMYLIGAYIRLHCSVEKINWCGTIAIVSAGLMALSVLFINILGKELHIDNIAEKAWYFREYNSILSVIFSISIFVKFLNIHFYSKVTNRIARSVMAIYLIHDNKMLRTVIWERIWPNKNYLESDYMLIHMVVKVFLVFVVALAIDQIRIGCIITIRKIFGAVKKVYSLERGDT